jgi:predicted Rossmann fold nucleotide-binding protein DprA/Smf involved in DNA uptake
MAVTLKKELQAVNKELKTLTKKVEKMIVAVGKSQPKPKAVKKSPAKKAAPSKTDKSSAIDSVLSVVKRSRKAVDIQTLKEKTGFQGQKLHNIVYILKKQGKIVSAGKGVYKKG